MIYEQVGQGPCPENKWEMVCYNNNSSQNKKPAHNNNCLWYFILIKLLLHNTYNGTK